METSAPKRRKLSPEQSVAVNNSNQNNDADDKPRDDHTTTTPPDPLPTAPPRSPERPSFASPTRASLARHNPDVLGRRQPAGRGKSPARADPSASRQPPPLDDAAVRPKAPLQHESASQNITGDTTQAPDAPGGLFAKPRRSPVRTLAAPGTAQEPEELNPFQGRTLRRSFPRPEQPEPELPQPPGPPDPILSTPPSGIHNTPSQRPRRSRALAERIKSSSPTKPKPAPPTQISDDQQGPAWDLPSKGKVQRGKQVLAGGDVGSAGSEQTPAPADAADSREERARRRAMRGIEDTLAEAQKKRERDELLAEVARLEADVEVLAQAQNGQVSMDGAVKNATADVLRRHLLPKEECVSSGEGVLASAAQWLEIAMNPMSFLPFGNADSSQLPILFAPESQQKDEQPLPTSHHPIPMTTEEELPFLQVFTPLAFTSTIAILPRPSTSDPLLQQHTISASCTTPPGLFSAQICMTVNAATHRVHSLSVPRLDPAAAPELAAVVAATTTAEAGRACHNNVCVLAWAMGEWVRVATRRARFWRVLELELASKEAMAAAVAMARSRRRQKGGKKGVGLDGSRQLGRDDGDDDGQQQRDGDDDSSDSLGKRSDLLSRAELLPHMGRTAMEIGVPVAVGHDMDEAFCLRIQWRIRFDWTGEAESEVELLTGVPGKWRKSDERGKLYGIPDLFRKLVEGDGDPISAVRAVVALLAGDGA
ncbi:uncharacterized protein PpBr36_10279 [Pyricularia pennisetigena]|uniref:uncharacterized protein n=1 Tax=Pyricularia pennisetigena TaxID=1578925 RepID=UPI001151E80F|nr:uncharacterized protein PpBr36_10279 [Pyricularia pennisetigena]TLS21536.1 hypothetical protein PpBr36_10279 [Pyricularia pennisetigena]